MKKFSKVYLGDSVYASCDGIMVMLTTENGAPTDPSNTIYLEDSVISSLHACLGLVVSEAPEEKFDLEKHLEDTIKYE